jgi:hypothetical protein
MSDMNTFYYKGIMLNADMADLYVRISLRLRSSAVGRFETERNAFKML